MLLFFLRLIEFFIIDLKLLFSKIWRNIKV